LFVMTFVIGVECLLTEIGAVISLTRDGATFDITGLAKVDETNPPGFWVVNPEPANFPNLANPSLLGTCLCLMHPNLSSFYPPPPWRGAAVGVVFLQGVGFRLAFSEEIAPTNTTAPQQAILLAVNLIPNNSTYVAAPGSPLCNCQEETETAVNDITALLNPALYPASNCTLTIQSLQNIPPSPAPVIPTK